MGIHVSFKGSSGRRINMDYDGSDASMDKLQEFAAAHAVKAPDDKLSLKMPEEEKKPSPSPKFRERGLVAVDHLDIPGFLGDKLARNSSLEVSPDRKSIRLKGDGAKVSKDRPLFYSRENDKPAWNPVSVLDPAEKGEHVGPEFGDLSIEPNDGSMDPDSGATSRTYLSRIATEFKTADACAQFIIYGFFITQYRTGLGRIIAESPERRAVIAAVDFSKLVSLAMSNITGGGGGGSGRYSVLPTFGPDGNIDHLYFGEDAKLASVAESGELSDGVTCVPVDTEDGVLVLIGRDGDNGA